MNPLLMQEKKGRLNVAEQSIDHREFTELSLCLITEQTYCTVYDTLVGLSFLESIQSFQPF